MLNWNSQSRIELWLEYRGMDMFLIRTMTRLYTLEEKKQYNYSMIHESFGKIVQVKRSICAVSIIQRMELADMPYYRSIIDMSETMICICFFTTVNCISGLIIGWFAVAYWPVHISYEYMPQDCIDKWNATRVESLILTRRKMATNIG